MQSLEIDEEFVDLIRNDKRRLNNGKPVIISLNSRYQQYKYRMALVTTLCAIGVCSVLVFHRPFSRTRTAVAKDYHGARPIRRYECPAQQQTAENIASARKEHEEWYVSVSNRIAKTNLTDYFLSFRDTEFDNWGHSYEEIKKGMYKWKSEHFEGLNSGDWIYESACGIGLNLFMTLEILNEVQGLTNLVVYGNEYEQLSAKIAQNIANGTSDHPNSFLPAQGHYGTICPADSSALSSFVPSNMFDLVYTGYISPLFNPLKLNGSTTNDNFEQYLAYCEGKTAADSALAEKAQTRQNEWYAAWVKEMIRIAKPGKPVIIEQVSYPLCDAMFDWGGVKPSFWHEAVKTYDWDVDPVSISIDKDSIFRRRYHVSMRKNS